MILDACLGEARPAVDYVTLALRAEGFRGELVPQKPNDEPAGALLERLHATQPPGRASARRAARSEDSP